MIRNDILYTLANNTSVSVELIEILDQLSDVVINYAVSKVYDIKRCNELRAKYEQDFINCCSRINNICAKNNVDMFYIHDNNIKNDMKELINYNLKY